jgi:prepilin-type N-terminal cleavage/methylation domain-containing protein
MSIRGFTLLEVLLAASILAVVMVGLGSFYLSTVRFEHQDRAQVSLQRQAESDLAG